jgi:hypothetical protein
MSAKPRPPQTCSGVIFYDILSGGHYRYNFIGKTLMYTHSDESGSLTQLWRFNPAKLKKFKGQRKKYAMKLIKPPETLKRKKYNRQK